MTILDQIIKTKKIELNYSKENTSILDLEKFPFFNRSIISLSNSIKNSENIQLYVQGLEYILKPTQNVLRKWILDNHEPTKLANWYFEQITNTLEKS